MLSWVVTFLVIALIAGVLGFGGVAGASIEIAKIIFFIAIVLFLISAVVGLVLGRSNVYRSEGLFRGHRHLAADALGTRQARVRTDDVANAGLNISRKRRNFPRIHVDMQREVFRVCGDPALGRV